MGILGIIILHNTGHILFTYSFIDQDIIAISKEIINNTIGVTTSINIENPLRFNNKSLYNRSFDKFIILALVDDDSNPNDLLNEIGNKFKRIYHQNGNDNNFLLYKDFSKQLKAIMNVKE